MSAPSSAYVCRATLRTDFGGFQLGERFEPRDADGEVIVEAVVVRPDTGERLVVYEDLDVPADGPDSGVPSSWCLPVRDFLRQYRRL